METIPVGSLWEPARFICAKQSVMEENNMYDRVNVYEKHIKKKAMELNELCQSLGIVSFMSFCVYDDNQNTEYKNFIYGSASNGIKLSDDQIRGHINVANGFQTVPPGETLDFDEYIGNQEVHKGENK